MIPVLSVDCIFVFFLSLHLCGLTLVRLWRDGGGGGGGG